MKKFVKIFPYMIVSLLAVTLIIGFIILGLTLI